MHMRNVFSLAICLPVFFAAVALAANTTITISGKGISINSTQTTTTSAPTSTLSAGQPAKNSTGKPDEDDCSDEEPTAEPEGAAKNATAGDRQGKQLHLDDKDKYTHEDGKAEPEPEGEPSGNSTSSTGKLTGNGTTTARPAHGSASTLVGGYTCGLTLIVGAIYLRIAQVASL